MKFIPSSFDTTFARKAMVGLALCSAPAVLFAQELTSQPAPANSSYEVNSAVYSATAAEIFWSAFPAPSAFYTVTRNGEVVVEGSSAISFFDPGLSPNTGYNYCLYVTADNDVQLSSGMVTLYTPDDGSGAEVVPVFGSSCPNLIPVAPSENRLRSSVYSSTAVEIFWGRDDNPDTTYSLFRDGVLLTKNRKGVSLFEDNLQPNTQYAYCLYDVVNNTVTDSEFIMVTTRDNGSGEPPMPPAGTCPVDPIGGGPIPVEPPVTVGELNLTGQAYSDTSLEIFWDRAPSPDVLYNVFRDGELVLSNSRANSFYESNLQPGSTFVYSVTGGANGNTSTSAAITLGTR